MPARKNVPALENYTSVVEAREMLLTLESECRIIAHNLASAEVAAQAEMPKPPAELLHREVGAKSDRVISEAEILERVWPYALQNRLLALRRNWTAMCDAVNAKHSVQDLQTDEEQLVDKICEARRNIIEHVRAETVKDVLIKLIMVLNLGDDASDSRAEAQRLMTIGDCIDLDLFSLFLDLQRLIGPASELENVVPFEPKSWVAEFEALPGHEMTEFGPRFMEPDAFPTAITDKDFVVSDSDLLQRHYAQRRAGNSNVQATPFIMGSRKMIADVYAGRDDEISRLEALWDMRQSQKAWGSDKWNELAIWQRHLVRKFAADRRNGPINAQHAADVEAWNNRRAEMGAAMLDQ
ncbi:MAG TPA: hypothetical protein VG407_08360 [Caulobacteraceae bacterium]|jgi:hypothetical protein|nr:hypothetical protein [Caulobacteraceae bacterium]